MKKILFTCLTLIILLAIGIFIYLNTSHNKDNNQNLTKVKVAEPTLV